MDFLKICCLVFMSFSMQLNAQLNFDLTVNVTGLENNDGVLQFGLYNNPDQFPIVGETFKMIRVKTKGVMLLPFTKMKTTMTNVIKIS